MNRTDVHQANELLFETEALLGVSLSCNFVYCIVECSEDDFDLFGAVRRRRCWLPSVCNGM